MQESEEVAFSPHPFPESHTHSPKTTPLMTHLMGGAHIARVKLGQSDITAQLI